MQYMIEVIERINKGDFWAQRPKRTKGVVPSSYDRDTRGVGDVAGALRKTSAGAAGGQLQQSCSRLGIVFAFGRGARSLGGIFGREDFVVATLVALRA